MIALLALLAAGVALWRAFTVKVSPAPAPDLRPIETRLAALEARPEPSPVRDPDTVVTFR